MHSDDAGGEEFEGPGRPGQFACGGLVAPNGLIYVPVQVSALNAGEPTVPTDGFLDAVVDTGTNSTVVSPSVVDRLGIVTRPGPAVGRSSVLSRMLTYVSWRFG